jgi:exodeoxyribonuclease VII large subunit
MEFYQTLSSREALSVSALNSYVKSLLDANDVLQGVTVRGEISNFVSHRSGHLYFSLKDEGGLVRSVMFRSSAIGLRFIPENGMRVIARGSVSLYPKDGVYQLYVTALERDGVGDLYLAFERLKKQLASEGLFDPERKRPIPRYPREIGIVTSPTGAAIRDMIRILGRRFPYARIVLYPARVQGIEAPGELAAGIRYFDTERPVDTVIIGRGGGSIEDLWAFNDEMLARTVAAARVPIISAVGHETDFTICDFVADLRAATPSAAAELAVPDATELSLRLGQIRELSTRRVSERIDAGRHAVRSILARPVLARPENVLRDPRMRLSLLFERMDGAVSRGVNEKRTGFSGICGKLEALSPLATLARGYAVAEKADGSILRSVREAEVGQPLQVRLSDGEILAGIKEIRIK